LILELRNQGYTAEYPIIININIYADEDVAKVEIEPDFMMLKYDSQFQFTAKALNQKGEVIKANINWESTGGTISQSGLYTSGSTTGLFNVIAIGPGGNATDTVDIVIDNTVEVEDKSGKYADINQPSVKIYPNPFSEFSIINYQFSIPGGVKIDIYNSLGNKITTLVDEWKEEGNHRAVFNGNNLASGVYYCVFRINGVYTTQKFVILD
jgi:hypothetical protein